MIEVPSTFTNGAPSCPRGRLLDLSVLKLRHLKLFCTRNSAGACHLSLLRKDMDIKILKCSSSFYVFLPIPISGSLSRLQKKCFFAFTAVIRMMSEQKLTWGWQNCFLIYLFLPSTQRNAFPFLSTKGT